MTASFQLQIPIEVRTMQAQVGLYSCLETIGTSGGEEA